MTFPTRSRSSLIYMKDSMSIASSINSAKNDFDSKQRQSGTAKRLLSTVRTPTKLLVSRTTSLSSLTHRPANLAQQWIATPHSAEQNRCWTSSNGQTASPRRDQVHSRSSLRTSLELQREDVHSLAVLQEHLQVPADESSVLRAGVGELRRRGYVCRWFVISS